jgi:origin recognition complex subunit 4
LDALKSGGKNTKSILFVLDEFDLFAHHHNQTLLYNLFDVSQSAQTPVCIIGLSARLDVVGLLEKRVKSRFSHRQLHLLADLNFDGYVDIFRMLLTLPEDFTDRKYAKKWQRTLKELSDSSAMKDVLRKQFNISKDIRTLQMLLILPVCHITPSDPFLVAGHFVDSSKLLSVDSKAAMLHGVSVLELCLVIAMKHVRQIYDDEPFNFEMVFKEYQKFVRRKSSVQSYEKPVVLKAFEHLCALELVRPVSGATRHQKEYRVVTLLVDDSQVTDALQSYPGCPTEVRQWGLSSALA